MVSKITYYDKVISIIMKLGGQLISSIIIDSKTKIKVKCKNGHLFLISPSKIQQGRWCRFCRQITFDEIVKYVSDKGGKVFGNFTGMKCKLIFQCDRGHSWEATVANVKLSGTWCPNCAGHSKLDISFFHDIASKRGGKCLSIKYNTQQDKLAFICANNHTWQACAKHIKAGHWCPQCKIYRGEEIVRLFLEYLFDNTFPKYKADWLINKYGNKLELDGYCTSLGIAFEHNGLQHYGTNVFRLENFDKVFRRAQDNDNDKEILCKLHGIALIKIPALGYLTKIENFSNVISIEFNRLNLKCNKPIIMNDDIIYCISKNSLCELNDIAKKRGGKCLSMCYINSKTPLDFECRNGHVWHATASNIKRGTWCPKCRK